jgi:hypothetical protein
MGTFLPVGRIVPEPGQFHAISSWIHRKGKKGGLEVFEKNLFRLSFAPTASFTVIYFIPDFDFPAILCASLRSLR